MPRRLEMSSETLVTSRHITIPPEILGKIYLNNALPLYPKHRGSRYPPMAVCKSWRNAALSHPQLWVRINLTKYSHLLQSSPDSLQTWLSRSKPRLLEVVMRLSNYQRETEAVYRVMKPMDVKLYQSILKVLFAQTYRWGSLDVLADDWQLSHIFQVLDRATRLHKLTLESYTHGDQTERLETVYELWAPSGVPTIELPSVTYMKLSLHTLQIEALPSLELPNLTELAFEHVYIKFEELMGMMGRMPKLALLRFELESWVSSTNLPVESAQSGAVVSELEYLVVWECFKNFTFLPHLARHCQNLRGITIPYMYCRDLNFSPVESLEEITLISEAEDGLDLGSISVADARNALKLGPNARELTLIWEPGDVQTAVTFDPFIKVLGSEGDGHERIMLKLEHLTLQKAVLKMSTLLQMVHVRSAGEFEAARGDEPFCLTLEGCYGLPDIRGGSFTEVEQLFADPPEINMTFTTYEDPYYAR